LKIVFLKLPVHVADYIIEDLQLKIINVNREEDDPWQEDISENAEINGVL